MDKKYKIVLNNKSIIDAENVLDNGAIATAIIETKEDGLRNVAMMKHKDITELYIYNVTEEEFEEITDSMDEPDENDYEEEEGPQSSSCCEVPHQYKSLPLSEIMYN